MKQEKTKIPKKYLKEIEHFKKTRVPRCILCKKNFVKIKEDSGKYHSVWKPDCKCFKKKLRLSIG